ncbi:MAG: hypothetical protein ACE14V_12120 [bacterium]
MLKNSLVFIYDELGQICLAQGKIDEARYWMLQLAELAYTPLHSPTALAKGLMERGYYQEVKKYYDAVSCVAYNRDYEYRKMSRRDM